MCIHNSSPKCDRASDTALTYRYSTRLKQPVFSPDFSSLKSMKEAIMKKSVLTEEKAITYNLLIHVTDSIFQYISDYFS